MDNLAWTVTGWAVSVMAWAFTLGVCAVVLAAGVEALKVTWMILRDVWPGRGNG